jgi:hypothetical protein
VALGGGVFGITMLTGTTGDDAFEVALAPGVTPRLLALLPANEPCTGTFETIDIEGPVTVASGPQPTTDATRPSHIALARSVIILQAFRKSKRRLLEARSTST